MCSLGLGQATSFTKCLYETGNVTAPKCYLQEWLNSPPDKSSPSSSSCPEKPGLSRLSAAFLGLLLLSGVTALQPPAKNPVCTKFEPNAQDTWNMNAEMPQLAIMNGVGCGSPPCVVDSGGVKQYCFEVQWAADGADGPIEVTGDYSALDLPKDRHFAEKVWPPVVPDNFTFAPKNVGFMAVRTNAVVIPGTYKDCQNGTEYRGNVTVPEASGLYYYAAVKSQTDDGPAPDTERTPWWQGS